MAKTKIQYPEVSGAFVRKVKVTMPLEFETARDVAKALKGLLKVEDYGKSRNKTEFAKSVLDAAQECLFSLSSDAKSLGLRKVLKGDNAPEMVDKALLRLARFYAEVPDDTGDFADRIRGLFDVLLDNCGAEGCLVGPELLDQIKGVQKSLPKGSRQRDNYNVIIDLIDQAQGLAAQDNLNLAATPVDDDFEEWWGRLGTDQEVGLAELLPSQQ
ncbi:MAG: hypothetical protein KDI46_01280 [Alphaproteobacteria bacterium]|nr:hypothetical protein [Alphaproteobacteria bacterium]